MPLDARDTARTGLAATLTGAIAFADLLARTGDARSLAIVDRLVALKRDIVAGDGVDRDRETETGA